VPAPLTADEVAALQVELEQLSGLTVAQIADLAMCSAEDRAMIVGGWREVGKLSWIASPSAWSRFLAILNALASVAAPLSVVTGGVSGLAGAIAAIKGI
jgi:hypothetical protein